MKRPHFHPARCRVCGFEGSRNEISQTGLCPEHSTERFLANLEQLRSQRGPFYEHWARQMVLVGQRALVAARRAELNTFLDDLHADALDDLREKA